MSTQKNKHSLAYLAREAAKVEVAMTEQLLPKAGYIEHYSEDGRRKIWNQDFAGYKVGKRRKRLLHEGMRVLPDNLRKCIVAKFWDDLSPREAARKLGISKSTVIRRQKKALETLKQFILNKEEEYVRNKKAA